VTSFLSIYTTVQPLTYYLIPYVRGLLLAEGDSCAIIGSKVREMRKSWLWIVLCILLLPMAGCGLFWTAVLMNFAKGIRGDGHDIWSSDPTPIPADPEVQQAIRVQEAIANKQVMLGMTAAQVRESWGEPDDINRTMTRWGTHEQWVYGPGLTATYVCLDDGIVTSLQD